VPRYELSVTHRPNRDGAPVTSRHVPYYLAAEVFSDAWARTLADLGPGVLTAKDVAVVGARFDYSHEVFTGTAAVTVDVQEVGGSSIRFGLQFEQDGRVAAVGTTTVARTDKLRTRAIPLSARQRDALEAIR